MYAQSVDHTFSLPYEIFEDRRSGEVLQKLQKARLDTQVLITSFVNILFLSIVSMVFVIIYAFIVHWTIGVTFFLIIPLLGIFVYSVTGRIRIAQRNIVKESAELAGATTETLRNVELVKSLGLEEQEIKRLNEVNTKILGLELKKIRFIRLLSFLQGTIVNAVRAGILFLMLWLLLNGKITIGEFLTLFFYSFFVFAPLGQLAEVGAQYQEARASNEKLQEILKIKPKKKPKSPVVLKEIKEINFKNVGFSYKSKNGFPSIRSLDVNLKSGETVAFVGLSGSGKTTLIKLLLGLYDPTNGKLSFNNYDSKKVDYDLFRKRIGLVSQETQLFAGTIRENLLFVNPKASDKQCLQVLKDAQISHILEKRKGLNTKIGEGGIKLSGGERQRLAIARALLRNPDIIIFDEATSSLDSLTEREITKTIKLISKKKPGLITIIVAHRLSTISHSDKICVLEKGQVIEKGKHSQLLKKKGLYYALWRQQIGGD
jgi:ATP-binding cassette, subfamily B, bacterial